MSASVVHPLLFAAQQSIILPKYQSILLSSLRSRLLRRRSCAAAQPVRAVALQHHLPAAAGGVLAAGGVGAGGTGLSFWQVNQLAAIGRSRLYLPANASTLKLARPSSGVSGTSILPFCLNSRYVYLRSARQQVRYHCMACCASERCGNSPMLSFQIDKVTSQHRRCSVIALLACARHHPAGGQGHGMGSRRGLHDTSQHITTCVSLLHISLLRSFGCSAMTGLQTDEQWTLNTFATMGGWQHGNGFDDAHPRTQRRWQGC